ncbi:MAG: ATP-binding protein [Anaerolineae bacterium]
MTLTQQFLIVLIWPLSFLAMAAYLWQSRLKRRPLVTAWSLTLVAAAVWASSVLRFYGGATFAQPLVFTWGIVGSYAFIVAANGLLLTTLYHLAVPRGQGEIAIGLSLMLGLSAIALDSAIWHYKLPDLNLTGQTIRHFDLWAAVWVASWLVPVTAAWISSQQISANSPDSLHLNLVHYWTFVFTLFFAGAGLASIRQPNQPVWQELGVLIIAVAAFTGTASLTNSQLPDLQLVLRQLLSRLSGTLIIFGLTWLALTIIVRGVADLPRDTNSNLILVLAAALFAGLFMLIYRLVNEVTRRLFLPALGRRDAAMANYINAIGNLPEPAQLGQLFLRIVQSSLATDEAWVFTAEDGPAGKLVLRPLASLDDQLAETVDFEADSPFANHLHQNQGPLVQFDINKLFAFDEMSESEKEILANWKRVLFMPLHAGSSLVGVLALGNKYAGEAYNRADLALLQTLADQISPLLAQSLNLASLRQINDYVFQQNQALARHKRQLEELNRLHSQFIELISPDLRQPFATVSKQLHQLQTSLAESSDIELVAELDEQINALKEPIDQLINMSARIMQHGDFYLEWVRLDEVVRTAIRNLASMAKARRVRVEYEPDISLPAVLADEQQLLRSVQHLLHNAIKFNKIGGVVHLETGISEGDVHLHIIDTGVGIPEERLETLWNGLSSVSPQRGARRGGLGLPLTRFVIAAHGGRIEAQSKYGFGSTFTIYLPLVIQD